MSLSSLYCFSFQSLNGVYVNGDRIIAALPWNLSIGDTVQLDIPTTDEQPEYVFDLITEKLTEEQAKEIIAKHQRDIENRKNRNRTKATAHKKQCTACVTRNSQYPHCPVHCAKAKAKSTDCPSGSRSNNNEKACLCSLHRKVAVQRTKTNEENTQDGPPQKRLREESAKEKERLREQLKEEAKQREAERFVKSILLLTRVFVGEETKVAW